jgi:hypothetical protein
MIDATGSAVVVVVDEGLAAPVDGQFLASKSFTTALHRACCLGGRVHVMREAAPSLE